jgi:hypothetical protein
VANYEELQARASEAAERFRYELEVSKWQRESQAKLYYSLTALFMGGFVLSVASVDKFHIVAAQLPLVHVFRIAAIREVEALQADATARHLKAVMPSDSANPKP